MNKETSIEVANLVAISKGEPLNNSNRLMQLIERKFNYLRSDLILSKLREEKYVEYILTSGVYYYSINSHGRHFVNTNFVRSKELLIALNPTEEAFICSLFDLWVNEL